MNKDWADFYEEDDCLAGDILARARWENRDGHTINLVMWRPTIRTPEGFDEDLIYIDFVLKEGGLDDAWDGDAIVKFHASMIDHAGQIFAATLTAERRATEGIDLNMDMGS